MVLPTTKMGITWKILCWFVFVSHIIVSAYFEIKLFCTKGEREGEIFKDVKNVINWDGGQNILKCLEKKI